jgi:hypothetical protein
VYQLEVKDHADDGLLISRYKARTDQFVTLLQSIHDIHPADHSPKNGITAIELRKRL